MKPISSVLVATDFSTHADAAVRRGMQLAASLGAALHLLHVVDKGRLRELRRLIPDAAQARDDILATAKRLMAKAARTSDLECEKRIEIGRFPHAILSASLDHDLLVLGAHGANRVREALIGSTADRLLLKSERPMLVVKGKPAGPYRRVLVPCEYAPPARRALELALQVAPGARVTLVHAFELEFEATLRRAAVSPERIGAMRGEAAQRAQAWLETLADRVGGGEAVGALVEHGSARRVVPDLAKRVGADLVVIGKQGRSAAGEVFLGSVTRHVLAEAHCDVLVAPASKRT